MKKNNINIFIQDTNQYFAQGLTALLQVDELCRHTTVTFLTHQNRYLADLIIVQDEPTSYFKVCPCILMNARRNILLIRGNYRYWTVSQTLSRINIIKRSDSINTVLQLIETAFKGHNERTIDDHLYKSPSLTFREGQVLSAIAQGLTPKRIGRQLDVHFKTVSIHKRAAMRKLGFSRNHELYLWLSNHNGLPQLLIEALSLSSSQKSNPNQAIPR